VEGEKGRAMDWTLAHASQPQQCYSLSTDIASLGRYRHTRVMAPDQQVASPEAFAYARSKGQQDWS
jgi:hypothetical protein